MAEIIDRANGIDLMTRTCYEVYAEEISALIPPSTIIYSDSGMRLIFLNESVSNIMAAVLLMQEAHDKDGFNFRMVGSSIVVDL